MVKPLLSSHPYARDKFLDNLVGGGGGVLDQYLGIAELLRVWNPDPVWDKKILQ